MTPPTRTAAGLLLSLLLLSVPGFAQETAMAVTAGSQVSFTYTLSSEGEVIESNANDAPMTYTQGGGQILPALEAELVGLKAGDEKIVNLSAANGYGEVREDAFQEIPLDQLPDDARKVGALLQAQGYPVPIRVAELKEDVAVLDFNHPLAGKDLTFDIVIVSVQPAPAPPSTEPVE
jgi:FKBP-type peptidyl-prolyl cis-trans isomerase 2